ncbi:ankyrin repeat-containing domain protein [Aspergillus californicus]
MDTGEGKTALFLTVANDSKEMTEFLLENGANPNSMTEDSRSLLGLAVVSEFMEITVMLLSKGTENFAIVQLLLDHGANVNAVDEHGLTPLHISVSNRRRRITRLLLERGARVDARYHDGCTALLIATRKRSRLMRLLVQHGADIGAACNAGQTASHLAALAGAKKDVDYLLDQEAKIDAQDNDGRTPLQAARQAKKDNVAEASVFSVGSEMTSFGPAGSLFCQHNSSFEKQVTGTEFTHWSYAPTAG